MSGTEIVEGGLTLQDQIEFAKLLDGKVDLIHVTSGTFHVPSTNQHMIPNGFCRRGAMFISLRRSKRNEAYARRYGRRFGRSRVDGKHHR